MSIVCDKSIWETEMTMLTKTKIALAAVLILGAAGVAQAATTGFAGSNMSSAPQASIGVPRGINPSNSQDLSYRSNSQDLTVPGANNRQDLVR
jgi:hypothetical protein